MAKELPYFKFEPGAWENGNIQTCSHELQGIFINLCAIYWQRLGELPYALALRKVCDGSADVLQALRDACVLHIDGDKITIDFLDEQLREFQDISEKNAKNARSGWKKRNHATVMRPHSERNAIREDKIREDESYIIHGEHSNTFLLINPLRPDGQYIRINGVDGFKEYVETNRSILPNATETSVKSFLRKYSGKPFNDFKHLWNAWNKEQG